MKRIISKLFGGRRKNRLVYEEGSDTVRQMPQNYLVAYRTDRRWICDPDGAADRRLAAKVFMRLFEYGYAYGEGPALIKGIK